MRIRPTNDNVIVIPNEAPKTTASGLFTVTSTAEKQTEGRVVAVGPGKLLKDGTRRRPEVEVGSIVIFTKHTGHEVDIDGTRHLFMSEDDILAVLSQPST